MSLKRWQKTLLIGVPLLFVVLVIPLMTFVYFSLTMGDMESLMNRNNTGVVLRDVNGEVFYGTGTARHREFVPLENIAKSTQQAVIASEDRKFYDHSGVSFLSTLRAVYGYALSGGGSFGGSTLTQQLAKMTLLSGERGFLRQYQAFSVAVAIEQRYTKDEILAMYLNAAYFGNNSFGIDQAARNYFNKKPADLSLAESAMLVGLLPAPSTYSPITGDAVKARKQQEEVLKRMFREGMISEEDRLAALDEQLSLQPPAVIANDAPHFTEMVLAELYGKYGEEVVERSGYQVTTTLDMALQRQARDNINKQLVYIQRMGGSNVGLIAIDPKNGEIRALIGSVDYGNEEWGKVNMATTKRQPGSTFKPLYYAGALADGVIMTSTIIRDEPININGFQPQNATRRFYGDVTVRQALARSLNIPAVKVMQEYGVEESIKAANRLGVVSIDSSSSGHGLSLAIGSAEAPLQQMTNAYAAFANQGGLYQNTTIHEIHDKFNKAIYTQQNRPSQGISAAGAYLVSSILSDQQARSFMFGVSLNIYGKTVAVKTGTTDDNRDAWTIGYTPDIAVGVWVGNNNNEPMISGGADMAGPIWRSTMEQSIGAKNPEFSRPSGVVERYVCYGSGGLADSAGTNTYSELFLVSALPASSCKAVRVEKEEKKPPEEERDADEPVDSGVESIEPEKPSRPSQPDKPDKPDKPTLPTEPSLPVTIRP